ncbi:hypothetical protein [Maribacter antarcticus]|uniref:hypothetical protein n=1 Tax=Maribacter antarcticus TaxID=505250 RepID=UPI00047CB3F9|nr:hypothetical protein [Maribacter antarcticus]
MSQKLLFIYNADSGLRNSIVDGAHKILSPATYNCNLCKLTHGALSEKKIWTQFRKELEEVGTELEFLHKNEFGKIYRSKFSHKFTFPIVLIAVDNGLEVLIHTHELNSFMAPDALISLVKRRV